jgi:peptidoglycan hydrolase-like protein with peptidoglycan-binding domain
MGGEGCIVVMTEAQPRHRVPWAPPPRPVQRTIDRDDLGAALPIALMDGATRQRYAANVQRTAGNGAMRRMIGATVQRDSPTASEWDIAPNPYATTQKGGGAKTELLANPYAQENEPITLSNPRFKGEPRLEKIAAGGAPLGNSDGRKTVKVVQQALIDLGFELVQHEKDGDFGPETQTAIRLFRQRRAIPGDKLSARALGELDRTAPNPGAREEHYFDYERLFGDGFLDVTLAVGFDENGAHTKMIAEAREWMKARSFQPMPVEVNKPEEFRLRRNVTYPTRGGDRVTREVIVRIKLVPPGPGAKGQYAQGLKDSEVAIYNGHARRGIGPDFDADKSAGENFVIGVNSALHKAGRAVSPTKVEQSHYVVEKKNDLEEMSKSGAFDKEKYRVWLFSACTTIAYFDELRGGILPDTIDRTNLDLIGTRKPAPLITEMASSLAMLDGILGAMTIEQITDSMDRAGENVANALTDISDADRRDLIKMTKQLNVHEGAGDNPIAQ